MTEKVTTMVLSVDLQCHCCYKKTKKLLCRFPQIRDQVYDEKGNKVTVTVVCCDPEKIRDKLYYRGGKVIKSVEIKEPAKPKEPEKPKEHEKPKVVVVDKPKEPEKPKVVAADKPKEPEKPKVVAADKPKEPEKPKVVAAEKPKSNGKVADAPPAEKPAEKPKDVPKPAPTVPLPQAAKVVETSPVQGLPQIHPSMAYGGPYSGPYYDGFGYGGGPFYHGYGYGVPAPPQPSYDGYTYGPGPYSNYRGYESYFADENPSACSVM